MSALKHRVFVEYLNTFGRDSSVLPEFERLVESADNFDIEFSVKFKNDKTYPFRINLWFHDNYVKNINSAFALFKEISEKRFNVNYSELKKYFDRSFDLKRLKQFVIGIDTRDETINSRLKLWFTIKNYPEKQLQVVESAKKDFPDIDDFVIHDELLFGFDFGYGGTTRMKVYPDFREPELNDPVLRKILREKFSEKVNSFIDKSHWLHISADDSGRRILHFHPKSWEYFIDFVGNKSLKAHHIQLISSPVLMKDSVISMYEDEIDSGKIIEFNYYVLM